MRTRKDVEKFVNALATCRSILGNFKANEKVSRDKEMGERIDALREAIANLIETINRKNVINRFEETIEDVSEGSQ